MVAIVSQDKFLGNDNKMRLISMFISTTKSGKRSICRKAESDADWLIIQTNIGVSATWQFLIVDEDVDLVMLIIVLVSADKNIFFIEPERSKNEKKIILLRNYKNMEIQRTQFY